MGLTLLAYATGDIRLHTKTESLDILATRMRYGHAWAIGEKPDPPVVVEDSGESPLVRLKRGTFVKIQLSSKTRPRRLSSLAAEPTVWPLILWTRTAIGQVVLDEEEHSQFITRLQVTDSEGRENMYSVEGTFFS